MKNTQPVFRPLSETTLWGMVVVILLGSVLFTVAHSPPAQAAQALQTDSRALRQTAQLAWIDRHPICGATAAFVATRSVGLVADSPTAIAPTATADLQQPLLQLRPQQRPAALPAVVSPLEMHALGFKQTALTPAALARTALWPGARLFWSEATIDPAGPPDPKLLERPAPWGSDLACLSELAAEGVEFEVSGPQNGIATPIRVHTWRFGGIEYVDYFRAQKNRHLDCRLALALARLGPVLRNIGVTKVIWSSAHRPLADPHHLPSGGYDKHNQALAIDIHGFVFKGGLRASVADHYEKGLGFQRDASCLGHPLTRQGLLLRLVACRMDASDLFQEILTPDYDAGHWDHFHVATFHPRDRWRRRHKRTALLEVDLQHIPGWAIERPRRARLQAARWMQAAALEWPSEYAWLAAELETRAQQRALRNLWAAKTARRRSPSPLTLTRLTRRAWAALRNALPPLP
jgi:hypothetical protein